MKTQFIECSIAKTLSHTGYDYHIFENGLNLTDEIKFIASTNKSAGLPNIEKSIIDIFETNEKDNKILVEVREIVWNNRTNKEQFYFGFETEEDEVNWENRKIYVRKNMEYLSLKFQKKTYTREEVKKLILKYKEDKCKPIIVEKAQNEEWFNKNLI